MIILKSISWDNCFSYSSNNYLNFLDNQVTQIVGHNGNGKSSIPLILEEGLFNKNSKGIKKSSISNRHLPTEAYSINIDFISNNCDYTVKVARNKSIKATLLKNGEDISSHTATNTFKQIEAILGFDFKTFSQLVYQSTTNSLSFLTATDTERKKFLIDLLELDKYLEYHEVFKELLKEYNNEKIKIESKIDTYKKWLSENNLEGMRVLTPINLEIKTEEEEILRAKLTSEIENILEKNKKISNNNLYKQQLNALNLPQYDDIIDLDSIETTELSEKCGRLKSEISSLKSELSKLKNTKGVCPTCNQPLDIDHEFIKTRIDEIKIKGSELTKELKQVELSLEEATDLNSRLKKRDKAQTEFESLYKAIDNSLPTTPYVEDDLKKQLKEVSEILDKKKQEIKEIERKNLEIERNNTKISLLKEQTEKTERSLKESENHLKDLELKVAKLEVLKKAFSTNGLIAYKIENCVKELEDIVNEYLIELSDGRFNLNFVLEKDKLNVEILDNGHIINIEALSSGELARVNTSTLLAIRKLMAILSKTHLNVLFLDEVINVLDIEGREKLVEILLKEEGLNSFIISHGWTHPLLSKIHIAKSDNISRIDNG